MNRLAGLALLFAVVAIPTLAAAEPAAAPVAAAAAETASTGPTSAVQLAIILAVASLIPALVLACTCFTRFVVVLGFVRNGLATQGAPPNQVLVGLALFMTLFVMAPVGADVYDNAVQPYLAGQIDKDQALAAATPTLRRFLLERTRGEDLQLFYDVSDAPRPASADDVPLRIAIPAFVISELNVAFRIGLIVLLPFLIIDLVVASVLSALGMVMLPPPIVSLPIKLLVFVAIDGWHLVVASLLRGAM
jgi:flagellar biosynthetic protein FliP